MLLITIKSTPFLATRGGELTDLEKLARIKKTYHLRKYDRSKASAGQLVEYEDGSFARILGPDHKNILFATEVSFSPTYVVLNKSEDAGKVCSKVITEPMSYDDAQKISTAFGSDSHYVEVYNGKEVSQSYHSN